LKLFAKKKIRFKIENTGNKNNQPINYYYF
jgi:hypothetical protein